MGHSKTVATDKTKSVSDSRLAPVSDPSHATTAADFNLMLRGLLHELRNPLSSILTAANLVEDTARESAEISDETSMLLGVIKKESLRLNRILTEFSNFIKLPEPHPVVLDFVQLTRDVVAQLQDDGVIAPAIQVVDELPAHCDVYADQSQLRTALYHLVRNAGEAMPDNGTLCLHLQNTPDNRAVLCLGDSGQGFSEESHERAFQPFYSTKVHGTGLGLSAARAIIEAAHGRIWIEKRESKPDEYLDKKLTDGAKTGDITKTSGLNRISEDLGEIAAPFSVARTFSSMLVCIELPLPTSES